MIDIRLKPEVYQLLSQLATERGISIHTLIRQMLDAQIAEMAVSR